MSMHTSKLKFFFIGVRTCVFFFLTIYVLFGGRAMMMYMGSCVYLLVVELIKAYLLEGWVVHE